MPTVSRRPRRRRKLAAGAAVALGAAITPEALGAVINVNSTADNVTVDGACTLREAITNANDDAATSADCTAGSGLDVIDFTALTLPATITLGGTSIDVTGPLVIDGTSETQLVIDGDDNSRIFTILDGDSGTHFTVAIDDLTLTNANSGPESIPLGGGAIFAAENLTLTNVSITDSDSPDVQSGGAVLLIGLGSGGSLPLLTLQNTTLTGNTASCCGGAVSALYADVSISNSTIDDNYAPTGGGLAIALTNSLLIDETNITGNTADIAGGLYLYGAANVTIEESVISGNESAAQGGGVMVVYGGPVTIRDTTISGNTAGTDAGGLYLYGAELSVLMERVRVTNNTAATYEGGMAIWGSGVTIVESQITGNQAAIVGGLYAGYGAYLYLVNTTVANNTATTGSVGGIGIQDSFAAIDLSTISGNTAPAGAAGNMFSYGSYLYVGHSIIANGSAIAGNDLVTADSSATINYTLIEDPTGATFAGANNITGVDPQLGPLQNNGGPTETMEPAPTSPAVNAGAAEFTTPANDQRGFTRPVGIVDLGAVEIDPGTLALSSDAYATSEGAGFVTITVNRTGGSDGAVSVNYLTTSGTATAGADFTTASGTLNWADGDAAPKSFNVPIADDAVFEGPETFNVALDTVVGATLGTSAAVVTIADNDSAPAISIDNQGVAEGDAGNTPATFTVSLSNPTTQTVTVDFGTAGVEATGGTDYAETSGTLTFDPLVTSQPVVVQVIGDTLDEINETFSISLTNPANATINDGLGTGTILDDDGAPSLSIGDVTLAEGDAGTTNFVFNVTLSPASGQTVTVDFTTIDGTAAAGSDYNATAGTLTFIAGDMTESITVPVLGDTNVEPDETFTVVLSNAPLATLADDSGTGTILADDLTADLAVTKSVAGTGPFLAGENAQFTITVMNAGPGVAANVHVLDTLPAGTMFVSASATPGSCTGTVTVDCNVGTLADGESATITLTVQLTMSGEITNTATATTDAVDPTPASGSATITVAAPAGAAVPTLNEWMLIALASALAAAAALKLRT